MDWPGYDPLWANLLRWLAGAISARTDQ